MRHLNSGEISPRNMQIFYEAVRQFYSKAASYALDNLPFNDDVLKNSKFVNFESRVSSSFTEVMYFISRYGMVEQESRCYFGVIT